VSIKVANDFDRVHVNLSSNGRAIVVNSFGVFCNINLEITIIRLFFLLLFAFLLTLFLVLIFH